MEYKYLQNNWIKKKKKEFDKLDQIRFDEDSFFETLDLEIDFFIQNSDYTIKIKNHINTRYSASSKNENLAFVGDIAYHNYEFLMTLYDELVNYYNDDFEEDSDLYLNLLFIYDKINELENEFFKYFQQPVFFNVSEEISSRDTDLSLSKANEKIVYLYKLGILDFLRQQNDFKQSVNLLATVLSAITGEKPQTIQPLLNPIYSSNVSQKNNPLKSKNAIKKVESTLRHLNIDFKK